MRCLPRPQPLVRHATGILLRHGSSKTQKSQTAEGCVVLFPRTACATLAAGQGRRAARQA